MMIERSASARCKRRGMFAGQRWSVWVLSYWVYLLPFFTVSQLPLDDLRLPHSWRP